MDAHVVAVGAVCLAIGWLAHAALTPALARSGPAAGGGEDDTATGAVRMGAVKMVLVVRQDLKMAKGKIAAQCGHASLGMYMKLQSRADAGSLLSSWFAHGQAKIALKSEDEDELVALKRAAQSAGLACHVVVDAGRTQISPNTKTVLAILGPVDDVDAVTGGLKLL